jgi:hypothetical protein
MILKIGRIVDGKIASTTFQRSQEVAIAMMFTPEELKHIIEAFQAHGPDGLCLIGPPAAVAHDATQAHPWLTTGWNDYLASIPASHNPRIYAQIQNAGTLVVPAGVKL